MDAIATRAAARRHAVDPHRRLHRCSPPLHRPSSAVHLLPTSPHTPTPCRPAHSTSPRPGCSSCSCSWSSHRSAQRAAPVRSPRAHPPAALTARLILSPRRHRIEHIQVLRRPLLAHFAPLRPRARAGGTSPRRNAAPAVRRHQTRRRTGRDVLAAMERQCREKATLLSRDCPPIGRMPRRSDARGAPQLIGRQLTMH